MNNVVICYQFFKSKSCCHYYFLSVEQCLAEIRKRDVGCTCRRVGEEDQTGRCMNECLPECLESCKLRSSSNSRSIALATIAAHCLIESTRPGELRKCRKYSPSSWTSALTSTSKCVLNPDRDSSRYGSRQSDSRRSGRR